MYRSSLQYDKYKAFREKHASNSTITLNTVRKVMREVRYYHLNEEHEPFAQIEPPVDNKNLDHPIEDEMNDIEFAAWWDRYYPIEDRIAKDPRTLEADRYWILKAYTSYWSATKKVNETKRFK